MMPSRLDGSRAPVGVAVYLGGRGDDEVLWLVGKATGADSLTVGIGPCQRFQVQPPAIPLATKVAMPVPNISLPSTTFCPGRGPRVSTTDAIPPASVLVS